MILKGEDIDHSALRRDMGAALAAPHELFSELHRVEDTEGAIEQELEQVSECLGDAPDSQERRGPDMLQEDGPPAETPEITDWTAER